ncbi:hypothetical protein Tcan_04861 [Toxocara canis]|uniref:Peptidase S1 domain-containing protein n=1 Tax=Toxocara canis TaxID=6265 RepID=A0A0B2VKG0_TOXCA|nr:hypothetical protein Tcan_04861 [Toxocara canis]
MFMINGEVDFTISTVQWVYKYGDGKAGDDVAMILLPDPVPFVCEQDHGERTYDRIVSIIRLPINNLKEFSSVWNDRQLQYGECKILGHGVIGRGEDTLDSGIRAGSKDVLPAVINNHNFIRFRNKLDNSSEISICQGDSGSPLVCVRDETPYVVGVAAFTAGRKSDAKPLCVGDVGADRFGFFDDIRQHLQWIRNELSGYGLLDILKEDYTKCGF